MSVILPLYSLLGCPRGPSSIWFPRVVRFGFPWCHKTIPLWRWMLSLVLKTLLYTFVPVHLILLLLFLPSVGDFFGGWGHGVVLLHPQHSYISCSDFSQEPCSFGNVDSGNIFCFGDSEREQVRKPETGIYSARVPPLTHPHIKIIAPSPDYKVQERALSVL